jgi:hypothetical protein
MRLPFLFGGSAEIGASPSAGQWVNNIDTIDTGFADMLPGHCRPKRPLAEHSAIPKIGLSPFCLTGGWANRRRRS